MRATSFSKLNNLSPSWTTFWRPFFPTDLTGLFRKLYEHLRPIRYSYLVPTHTTLSQSELICGMFSPERVTFCNRQTLNFNRHRSLNRQTIVTSIVSVAERKLTWKGNSRQGLHESFAGPSISHFLYRSLIRHAVNWTPICIGINVFCFASYCFPVLYSFNFFLPQRCKC